MVHGQGLKIKGLRFRVKSTASRIQGLEFRVKVTGSRVQGLESAHLRLRLGGVPKNLL